MGDNSVKRLAAGWKTRLWFWGDQVCSLLSRLDQLLGRPAEPFIVAGETSAKFGVHAGHINSIHEMKNDYVEYNYLTTYVHRSPAELF
jgi:hypothetical protein